MAETKDTNEYNSLVKQKNNTQAQYNACQDRIEEQEYLLKRLKAAKEVVSDQKDVFRSVKKDDKDVVKEKYSWKGSNYDEFKNNKGQGMMDENETYYKYSIDHVLDSLNNEITRIENQRLNDYGLLGKLGASINSLTNKIENFFN